MKHLALHWQILIAMILGAAIGIGFNNMAGERRFEAPELLAQRSIQPLGSSSPVNLPEGQLWVEDTPNQILIQLEQQGADGPTSRRIIVRGPVSNPVENWPEAPTGLTGVTTYTTLKQLEESDPLVHAAFLLRGRSRARLVGDVAQQLGDLFLRMLKMVSIPLIMASLISGVTGLGAASRLGKMFGRTLLYYMTTSMIAIFTGLLLVNVVRPGVGQGGAVEQLPADTTSGKSLGTVLFEQLQNMIPPNPFEAAADGAFLSIIAFSIAFGVFTIFVGGKHHERITEIANACFEVMMRMTMAIIHLAPIGVFFLILAATASQGAGVFGTLGLYMITVLCALTIHAVVTMPLILKFVAKRNPWDYARSLSPALLTAFSSASSNGTLPLTMTCVEERAGVSNKVSSFVLPLGATVNMDGTALYEVVAVLFIAQYNGIELALGQQIVVAFTALLASIGAAGIPHAGLVMMLIILQAVGLPVETQGLIIAVDRVLDMGRTAVNVWSDACGCAVVESFDTTS
jgi:Na+/H+-dicarboxylate symporter